MTGQPDPAQSARPSNALTGGDWEDRANDYWRAWHNSARIADEEQMRAGEAMDALRAIRERTDKEYDDEMIEDVVDLVDRVLYPIQQPSPTKRYRSPFDG